MLYLSGLLFLGLFSAIISGFIGMGGGVTLLALLTLFYPLHVVVPLHGVAQLASNVSRCYWLYRDINRPIFYIFALGSPLGGVAAFLFLDRLARPEWIFLLIVALLLYTAFKPSRMPRIRLNRAGYFILGGVSTFLGALVGATGPLLAPFFLDDRFPKESIVATKAACQICIHLVKVPVFWGLAFRYQDYIFEILVLLIGVVIGSRLGIELLRRVSELHFLWAMRVLLVLTSMRLLYNYMI